MRFVKAKEKVVKDVNQAIMDKLFKPAAKTEAK
jgi:hypothetical protein